MLGVIYLFSQNASLHNHQAHFPILGTGRHCWGSIKYRSLVWQAGCPLLEAYYIYYLPRYVCWTICHNVVLILIRWFRLVTFSYRQAARPWIQLLILRLRVKWVLYVSWVLWKLKKAFISIRTTNEVRNLRSNKFWSLRGQPLTI